MTFLKACGLLIIEEESLVHNYTVIFILKKFLTAVHLRTNDSFYIADN